MSEPVVQRQAVPDPQEALRANALRNELAVAMRKAFTEGPVQVHISKETACLLADAVLPVVQAHTQAQRDELLDIIAEQEREKDELRDKLSKKCIALASLRDAVSRLADDLEAEARDWRAHDFLRIAKRGAARRLRSLLPQEG